MVSHPDYVKWVLWAVDCYRYSKKSKVLGQKEILKAVGMKCVGVVSDCTYTRRHTHQFSPFSFPSAPHLSPPLYRCFTGDCSCEKGRGRSNGSCTVSKTSWKLYTHFLTEYWRCFFSDQACFLRFIFGGSLVSRGKFLCESYICKNQLSILWICVQDQPTFL